MCDLHACLNWCQTCPESKCCCKDAHLQSCKSASFFPVACMDVHANVQSAQYVLLWRKMFWQWKYHVLACYLHRRLCPSPASSMCCCLTSFITHQSYQCQTCLTMLKRAFALHPTHKSPQLYCLPPCMPEAEVLMCLMTGCRSASQQAGLVYSLWRHPTLSVPAFGSRLRHRQPGAVGQPLLRRPQAEAGQG